MILDFQLLPTHMLSAVFAMLMF